MRPPTSDGLVPALPGGTGLRAVWFFNRGRDAWGHVIQSLRSQRPLFLMPAYLGWSPRDGSGLWDPIESEGADVEFYGVDRELNVRAEDIDRVLASSQRPIVLLLVHWFGFVDSDYRSVVATARERGTLIVDDVAHAALTFKESPRFGSESHLALYSYPKLFGQGPGRLDVGDLPVWAEGLVPPSRQPAEALLPTRHREHVETETRRANYRVMANVMAEHPAATLLRPDLPEGVVPQSLPILVSPAINRDAVYERCRAAGLGVASLYHTLVAPVRSLPVAADARAVAQRVLNLPVHSSVTDPSAFASRVLGILDAT